MAPLLNAKQLSAALGKAQDGRRNLGYIKILQLAKQGVIPCVRVETRYFFRLETIQAWFTRQEVLSGKGQSR